MSAKQQQQQRQDKPASAYTQEQRVQCVVVDALVVAKVAKFARDSPGNKVMGSLLGMQNQFNLEVTDCFVIPDMKKARANDDGDEDETGGTEMDSERMQQFKDNMLNAMRAVNADFDEVGLFQICDARSLFDQTLISNLLEYQSTMSAAVILAYDPTLVEEDTLSVRAFRLSDVMLKFLGQQRGDQPLSIGPDELKVDNKRLTSSDIFEEIPMTLHTSVLARAAIPELISQTKQDSSFEELDMSLESFLEDNISAMMNCIDELSDEAAKYHRFKDSAGRNQDIAAFYREFKDKNTRPPTMRELQQNFPDEHLETPTGVQPLLINSQISAYCDHLAKFSSQGISTLYLTETPNAVKSGAPAQEQDNEENAAQASA
ncbi:hypothetical protein PTSG_09365 [Salpingoeca rosetta]|uniref:Uncharacterized protein n=1 Tax=Salpingoeca rosetta (strain ATCC 50818 / BSB-021) TaxID=946362 RepID=F2UMF0_SALR5|nr:uncharacterized protein PTSG_09365 [Salpingoeca rosetta]EGD78299.1 hypothetical protein PTSG_09365 [Salpingoeca rosetta]|eukprot:XP_004989622.1 hypothetical protein PTSG_09365 [Salpingoeca rosetta]